MASSMSNGVSRVTTWDAVKRRRLTVDSKDNQPVSKPQQSDRTAATAPTIIYEDLRPRIQASVIRDCHPNSQIHPGPYTQRQHLASTPGATQNPLLSLSHPYYGLPDRLVQNLRSMGIRSMFPWQSSCLLGKGNLSGKRNLVYTAPTGGGKSLVADIIMFKRVLEGKKALLVLPYVALIQEKLRFLHRAVDGVRRTLDEAPRRHLPPFLDHELIRIGAFYGGSKTRFSWLDIDIAVCTVEKANMLLNAAILENTTEDLGVVVLDELHMLDDDHRGYLMEVLAAKLLSLELKMQIIGMSATLANTELLARWLKAKYYESRYKPIPIEEHLVCDNAISNLPEGEVLYPQLDGTPSAETRWIDASSDPALRNPVLNAVVALVMETVEKQYGVLVFCNSRSVCETTAMVIAQAMPSLKSAESNVLAKREDVINTLKSLALLPLDETLAETILYGVGFHHAGLTSEERQVLNEAFDAGVLRVIVATASLAAGVNLPARRVILQGARMGREMVGPAMLRQMRGRAGRKGKDEIGETFVCCKSEELDEVRALLSAELTPIQSSLTSERRGIKRAVLESIVVRLATHELAVREFVGNTLLAQLADEPTLADMIANVVKELRDADLIQVNEQCYQATALGRATVASGLAPEDSAFVYDELQRAMTSFVMVGEMHVFYIFTPVSHADADEIDWAVFRQEIASLNDSSERVMVACGVNPGFVNAQANSKAAFSLRTPADLAKARIHRRFYSALQLRDLCNEMPLHVVSRKYHVSRGAVQTLLQACQGFAGATIRFCKEMGWGMLAAVLEHMSDRLQAGARADLLELAQIPFVKSRTARVLWENGYRGCRGLAEADLEVLAQVLMLAQPNRRKTLGINEEGYLQKLQTKAAIIIRAASRLWEKQQQVVDIEADL